MIMCRLGCHNWRDLSKTAYDMLLNKGAAKWGFDGLMLLEITKRACGDFREETSPLCINSECQNCHELGHSWSYGTDVIHRYRLLNTIPYESEREKHE